VDENGRTRVQVWSCLPMQNRRLTVDNCRGKRAVSCARSKRVQMFSSKSGIDRKHVEEIAEEYKDSSETTA